MCGDSRPSDTESIENRVEETIARVLTEKVKDRDLAIRDLSNEALDRTVRLLKVFAWLSSVPILATLVILGLIGVNSGYGFYMLFQPKLQAAISTSNEAISKANAQLATLSARDSQIRDMSERTTEAASAVASLQASVHRAQTQLSSVTSQVRTAVNAVASIQGNSEQSEEGTLQQDFASLSKGVERVKRDGLPYALPSMSKHAPIIYLEIPAGPGVLSNSDQLKRFASLLKSAGYSFIHGDFAIYRGNQGFAGDIVPLASYCTQIDYFNRINEPVADRVAQIVSSAFALPSIQTTFRDLAESAAVPEINRELDLLTDVTVAISIVEPNPGACKLTLGNMR